MKTKEQIKILEGLISGLEYQEDSFDFEFQEELRKGEELLEYLKSKSEEENNSKSKLLIKLLLFFQNVWENTTDINLIEECNLLHEHIKSNITKEEYNSTDFNSDYEYFQFTEEDFKL